MGKSTISALMAVGLARQGAGVAILDADTTGPGVSRLFGSRPEAGEDGDNPSWTTGLGIRILSLKAFLEREDVPAVWQEAVISGAVKRFLPDDVRGQLDYVIVNFALGARGASLAGLRSLPIDGVAMVTTPHDLSQPAIAKAMSVFRVLGVPALGLVMNMAWMECPGCGEKLQPFGDTCQDAASGLGLPLLATLPLDPRVPELCEMGAIEDAGRAVCESLARDIAGPSGEDLGEGLR